MGGVQLEKLVVAVVVQTCSVVRGVALLPSLQSTRLVMVSLEGQALDTAIPDRLPALIHSLCS